MTLDDWSPDPNAITRHLGIIQSFKTTRQEELLEDHRSAGFLWNIWITYPTRRKSLPNGYLEWIEEHQGIESFDFWSDDILVSFKTADDAVLFKLTFSGM
jgi:hypothetical protein